MPTILTSGFTLPYSALGRPISTIGDARNIRAKRAKSAHAILRPGISIADAYHRRLKALVEEMNHS